MEGTAMTPEETVEHYQKLLTDAEKKLESLKADKAKYEKDFALLQHAEELLGALGATVGNDSNTALAIKTSVENIRKYGTQDNVPGFEEMFTNFDTSVNEMGDNLSAKDLEITKSFTETGKQIDTAQTEISEEIVKIKSDIGIQENRISFYKTQIAVFKAA